MYQNILVPLDGSELAECVLPHVETLVKGCGVKNVYFIRVVEPIQMPISEIDGPVFNAQDWRRLESVAKSEAEQYLKQLAGRVKYEGISVISQVVNGFAAGSIVDFATSYKIDLIAIATHGRSGISRWFLGSVADRVLRSAQVPVLMVRAPGSCSSDMQ